jgi:hypothetical protein
MQNLITFLSTHNKEENVYYKKILNMILVYTRNLQLSVSLFRIHICVYYA